MNQNFNLIYQTSFKNDSFLKLQDFCKEMMSKELEKIFNSIDFNSISEKCLISLIQHENSQKNIIQVWKHVLKWEFVEKVYPFKKVIPKELREKLIKDFIYRPIKKPEQKMIKEISSKSVDSKIITVHINILDEILGGYNPDIWKSDKSWGAPKDGFMFSFMNKDNIKDYILIRVTRGKFATYNDVDCGPAFTVVLF
ncbi:BTB/POZ protein [Rhizophagus clarus]|uniref:BTB/POZ protein n=1 Tax=Rhizophagus clarus TaxID=94130 RepID=A0A8H3R4J3_9GLOM|nr:BTB/POZ protein [Rhizophagus clarus]